MDEVEKFNILNSWWVDLYKCNIFYNLATCFPFKINVHILTRTQSCQINGVGSKLWIY